MESGQASSGCAILPDELLHLILEISVDSCPCSAFLPILLLSKSIHHFFLPRLYHTIPMADESKFWDREGIDRELLLRRASPASLNYVRRLACKIFLRDFSLSSFPNLTHLALLGSQNLARRPRVATGLMMLPLQELFIWHVDDSYALLNGVTTSSTILDTLQRLTTFSQTCTQPDTRWLRCRRLTHIMALCDRVNNSLSSPLRELSDLQNLECFVICTPLDSNYPLSDIDTCEIQNQLPRPHSRTLVCVRRGPFNWFLGKTFWGDISRVWNEIEMHIQKNSNPNVSVLTLFPLF
ncbi:hypothetical protein DL96DRAFT_542669 [Flagelloscypha sp. PMI_526]|nr:hypothetical protein DL96DRAFT_542669 [Flagelloscypha sp. PMI_526]